MIPKRKSGEDRNAFVSRCIKELVDKDPEKDQTQIIAICETQADLSEKTHFSIQDWIKYIDINK